MTIDPTPREGEKQDDDYLDEFLELGEGYEAVAKLAAESIDHRKRVEQRLHELTTVLEWYADPGNWYAPEGPEASVIWKSGKPWELAADVLNQAPVKT